MGGIVDRLTAATGDYGNLLYSYDAVGNRLSESRNSTTDTYQYATNSNQLFSVTRTSGNRNFTYDAAGNPTQRTSDDNKTHDNSFNNANRLSSVNVNGTLAATYTYNPLGQRVMKTLSNGSKEIYHYDEAGQLVSVTDAAGVTQREYIYWGNQQIALINGNTINYIHNDHLNTPQVVTNQSQQVVWMGDYEPFGKLAANQSNSIEIFSRFPGQYLDQETNLYYNYFRDYDPSIGRYLTSDPIGLAGGINTYAYVEGNPLKYIDPNGLSLVVAGEVIVVGAILVALAINSHNRPQYPSASSSNSLSGSTSDSNSLPISDAAGVLCPPGDGDDGCKKASDWQLREFGIHDAHAFKKDYVTGSLSKYDICICRGGIIKIKGAGKCGKPGPSIETF